ncbi:condensation domain-containing protein [Pseudovibrio denitrificans]|uniref:condensation domain-containing protein n=1 Tax=Pseudovibrio denitrificans TaxID=258256 RepID=UPI0039BF30A8
MKHDDLDIDKNLIESRIIDSLSFVEFILFIEELRGSSIDPASFGPEVFTSLRTIGQAFFTDANDDTDIDLNEISEPSLLDVDCTSLEYPLTHSQKNWLYYDECHPELGSWVMPTLLQIRGPLEYSRLEKALEELTRRHDGLRIQLKGGDVSGPTQIFIPEFKPDMPVISLEDHAGPDVWQSILKLINAECNYPLDPEKGPPWVAKLIRISSEHHLLLVALSHILVDLEALIEVPYQVAKIYSALGEDSTLMSIEWPPTQYSQHALWQKDWLESAEGVRQVQHRRKCLNAVKPFNLGAPFRTQNTKEEAKKVICANVAQLGDNIAAAVHATPVVVGLAVYAALLHRHFGHHEMPVSLVLGFRTSEQSKSTSGVIGCYTNQQPMVISVEPKASFLGLVQQIREVVLEAFRYRNVPTRLALDEQNPLDSERAAVTFNWMNLLDYEEKLSEVYSEDTVLEPVILGIDKPETSLYGGIAHHTALTIRAVRTSEGISVFLATTKETLGEKSAELLADKYVEYYNKLVADPNKSLSEALA